MLPATNSKKKKVVIFVLVAVILLALAFFVGPEEIIFDTVGPPPEDPLARQQWLSDNINLMDHDQFVKIDYQVPSWQELDSLNQSLPPRSYPRFIKAIQTYGTLTNLVEVLYFGDVLKDMGVNTQFIHANYWFKRGEFKLWYMGYKRPLDLSQDASKRALVHNILLARQQGLAVILFPDYFQLENNGMNELGISDDLETRLEAIALELAPIAEKYQVEYLVPSNQIEMILESNGYSIPEAQRRTNAYYAAVVPKIKQIYSGKILFKMGGFGNWDNYDDISLEGADIFGFTGCYNRNRNDIEFVTMDIQMAAVQASKLSKEYGIPWFNAEFVISDDPSPGGESQITQKIPIEDYYEAGLAAFDQQAYSRGAMGFTVHSLLGSGKVYDTPAMPLIKEFFTSKP